MPRRSAVLDAQLLGVVDEIFHPYPLWSGLPPIINSSGPAGAGKRMARRVLSAVCSDRYDRRERSSSVDLGEIASPSQPIDVAPALLSLRWGGSVGLSRVARGASTVDRRTASPTSRSGIPLVRASIRRPRAARSRSLRRSSAALVPAVCIIWAQHGRVHRV